MQSTSKEIYKITSARTGKDETLYRDIGNFVQKETYYALKNPKTLIIKLKGLGFWFLRKTRLQKALDSFPETWKTGEYDEFVANRPFLNKVNKKEFYEMFEARLAEYEKYIIAKQKAKQKKDEYKRLHQEQEGSDQSCQD